MKNYFYLFVAGFFAVQNTFAAPFPDGKVRLVLRNPSKNLRTSARQANFGLTEIQKRKVFNLTGADLRNIYFLDVLPSEVAKVKKRENVLASYFEVMPPPFLTSEPDPELKEEWWIQKLNVPEAWNIATGKGITIADCDAGFYVDETDIHNNLLLDFAKDFSAPENPNKIDDGRFVFHGTAVAAIISGILDGKDTNGIAFDSKIVPLQNFNYSDLDKVDKEEATAACILHAITIPDVKVIVLENQTYGSSETFVGTREAVRAALQAGLTIVSAAGNSNNELLDEAKDDTGSIIVGALEQDGSRASFSNYGSRVSVAAFGKNLWTLFGPNGKFGEFGGTSGATPQVAATVALMLQANSKLSSEQIKSILIETRMSNRSNESVGGQLDVYSAVKMASETQGDEQIYLERKKLRSQLSEILANP